jgi:hypothetical protein
MRVRARMLAARGGGGGGHDSGKLVAPVHADAMLAELSKIPT